MQPLATRNNFNSTEEEDCASLVMSTVPLIMSVFKGRMRANRPAGLSVAQFRSLIFIGKNPGACLTDLADRIGLALSTTSRLVDGLVKRGFVERTVAAEDRRRAIFTLTESGKVALNTTQMQAHAYMSKCLAELTPREEAMVSSAMQCLHRTFRCR